MQKVAEPSRRSGAVTEYLARARSWHTKQVPRRIKPAQVNLESQLQQLREQAERREGEWAELRSAWPPWKGRKKRGSEPTG